MSGDKVITVLMPFGGRTSHSTNPQRQPDFTIALSVGVKLRLGIRGGVDVAI